MSLRRGFVAGAALALLAGQAAADDIKLGFLGGITGPIKSLVPPIVDGAQLALRHVNEQGGLLGGNNAVLVLGDGGCTDAAKAAQAAEKLVNVEKIIALVGGLCSPEAIAAANKAGIPGGLAMISPSATSPAITRLADNDLIFRTAVSDAYQGEALARLIAAAGVKEVAITHVNNDYGRGLAEALGAAFANTGGKVAMSQAHADGKDDYRAELEALAATGVKDLAIIGYADGAGGAILRQALESGGFTRYFSADGMASDKIAVTLGKQLEGKFFLTRPGAPEITGAAAFKKLALAAGIKADGIFVANSYDAAFVLALAIQQAGSADRTAVAKAVRDVATAPGETILPGEWAKAVEAIKGGRGVNYEGATGNLEFDANGDVLGTFVQTGIKDGKFADMGEAK
jgi:branched-chain amino acid transport system substrate-binding protein